MTKIEIINDWIRKVEFDKRAEEYLIYEVLRISSISKVDVIQKNGKWHIHLIVDNDNYMELVYDTMQDYVEDFRLIEEKLEII